MTGAPGLLLRRVAVYGRPSVSREDLVDVRVRAGRVAEVGAGLTPQVDEEVVEGGGATLLPGLHDHHVHLLALAASLTSVHLGPPAVRTRPEFVAALTRADRQAPAGEWLRGVGYHESVAGPLDRHLLDAIVPDRPVRVQHRSGAQWTVNSAGARILRLSTVDLPGIERDADGSPTGRLHRMDAWLAAVLPRSTPPLAPVGRQLARYGVTGVTDATPFPDGDGPTLLAEAVRSGALPQDITVMSHPSVASAAVPAPLRVGPVKLLLSEPDLPDLDQVVGWITAAHAARRPVAVHAVTRTSLALAIAAWNEAGAHRGDRVEHASVVPPEFLAPLREHGITVVTQPGFVAARGDQYLTDVDTEDLPYLYPCARLLDHGIPVGGSTDAPFGPADPWPAIRAAATRRTAHGAVVGPAERVPVRRAIELFLGPASSPGGPIRTVRVGAPADLVLLAGPVPASPAELDARLVVATVRAGTVIHRAE